MMGENWRPKFDPQIIRRELGTAYAMKDCGAQAELRFYGRNGKPDVDPVKERDDVKQEYDWCYPPPDLP
jgi:hypothetical protein